MSGEQVADPFIAARMGATNILAAGARIGYAADWSEYFGHQPGDGSGDVFFHLDPLRADSEIDFIGIDNYMPLSDWRDGFEHLDGEGASAIGSSEPPNEGWPAIYDRAYLQANIAGGGGFDWFYASAADRSAQILYIAAPPNGSSAWVRVVDEVSGAVFEQEITADLPAATQFLSPRLYMNTGATAAAVAFDCAGVYLEMDY